MCIEYVCCGGRIAILEKLVSALVECFVIVTVVFVLNIPLDTLPMAKSLVQSDRLLEVEEAGFVDVGEIFLYTPSEYFPIFSRGLGNHGQNNVEVAHQLTFIRLPGIIDPLSFARSDIVMHFMHILQ